MVPPPFLGQPPNVSQRPAHTCSAARLSPSRSSVAGVVSELPAAVAAPDAVGLGVAQRKREREERRALRRTSWNVA